MLSHSQALEQRLAAAKAKQVDAIEKKLTTLKASSDTFRIQ